MKIPLNEFEQHIDETILKRGFQYFKKGLVNEPEEIGPGEYEAIVEGTDQYTVRILIKNDVITEYVCSCPYDMGPVCKHVVAVIFHLQQNEIDLYKKPQKKSAQGKKVNKKKTVTEQVDELLEKLSHENLKDYIKERCMKESSFRQLFLANFAYLVNPESKTLYAKQIRAILQSAKGRDGFIGYSRARQVGIAVSEILQRAEILIELSNYQTVFYMACAVLEEMTKALQFAEDSNGDIGGAIDPSMDILLTLAHQSLTDDLRKTFFAYCINAYRKELFKGWDWHFSMLDLATQIAKNDDEAEEIHSLLDSVECSDSGWDWDLRQSQIIRLALIRKMEGEEKALQFLEQNISNPEFRKLAIERALAKKEFDTVIMLAEDGIKNDGKAKPGLADDWYEYLLQAYISKHDTVNSIKYARYLFLNANREEKRYYTLMKSFVSPGSWGDFIGQIIKDIADRKRGLYYSTIAQIYIWEERWNKLFEMVKQNVTIDNLNAYEKYLMKDYSNEISGFYQIAILDYLENNVSRVYYQNACRYLRKLIKMGERGKADFVIQKLRKLYPQRRALMEELERV